MMKKVWVRIAIFAVLVVLAVAADAFRRAPRVSGLASVNPKKTHWMEVREKQARKAGRKWKPAQSWVPLQRVSRSARQAVLAAEDAAFYGHEGFDFHEMKAALERDWKRKKWARGASTISQQLAKNLWLSPRKTLWRKAEEAILTVRLERALKKDRILELYLNVAEWGPGVFGIEAASWRYLGKSSADLSAEEGALLAAMLPNPFRLQPATNPRGVSKRQAIILRRMRRLGWLPVSTAAPEPPQATAEPLPAPPAEEPLEEEIEPEEESEEMPAEPEAPSPEAPPESEPPRQPPDQAAEGS